MSARVSSLWAADEDGETSKALTSSKEFVRRWQALRAQPEARVVMGLLVPEPEA